jgi:CRISPR-associated protein Cas5t
MDMPLRLLVEVPVCAFRPYTSREYQDTFPVPTPSAVYGMLLSLVGVPREEKERHRGVSMALAVERNPQRAKVFRKLRRDRQSQGGNHPESRRPDYQDLLIDLRLWIWLKPGDDAARPPLPARVKEALDAPETVTRFGGLSLGESSYLIDSITDRAIPPPQLVFLRRSPSGFYSLPVWVDHQNSRNTLLARFAIGTPEQVDDGLLGSWFKVGAP